MEAIDKPEAEVVTIEWWKRLLHFINGIFAPEVRAMTSVEIAQRGAIARLEEQVQRLRQEIDQLKAEARVSKIETEGQALIITMHEKRWEAETEQAAIRIAAATKGRQ